MVNQKQALSPLSILRKVIREMESQEKIHHEMEEDFQREWEKWDKKKTKTKSG